jgi:hypothetical protein
MSAWDSWRRAPLAMTAASALTAAGGPAFAAGASAPHLQREPRGEGIYFVLPDRFANGGYGVNVGPLDYRIRVSEGLQ